MFVLLFVRTVFICLFAAKKCYNTQHSTVLQNVSTDFDLSLTLVVENWDWEQWQSLARDYLTLSLTRTVFTTLTTLLTWYRHKWKKPLFQKGENSCFYRNYHGLRSSNPLTILKIWSIVFRLQNRKKLR